MSPMRPLNLRGFLVGSRHEPVPGHTDALHLLAELVESWFVQLDERQDPDRRPADYGQHQREAVARGPDHRLGIAAKANPNWQVPLRERRTQVLVGEWGTEPARPGDGLVSQQAHKQVELLLEDV